EPRPRPCMAAAVELVGLGVRLAEVWLLRGPACPACPACPTQSCTLTCSGPATSYTEPAEAPAHAAAPGWLAVWLAAAAGAVGAWAIGRLRLFARPPAARAEPSTPPALLPALAAPAAPAPETACQAQVLIDFMDDENGLRWHARLLIIQTPTPGVWIGSTPDFSVQRIDLNVHRVIALARGQPYPPAQWAESYVFDNPIPDADLTRVRQQAAALAAVLGQAPPAGPAAPGGAGVWRVADPAARSFGDEVPAQILSDRATFMTPEAAADEEYLSGLVLIDNCWTFCQLVADDDRAAWERALVSGNRRDDRVTGDAREPVSGRRFISFADSFGLQHAAAEPPFPLSGSRVTHEFVKTLRATGMEWMSHHLDFIHKSGISPNSNITRAHRRLTEALHAFQQQDMLNLPSLSGVEILVRYLVQIEMAVARNPRSPDFQDLDAVVASTVNEYGGLVLPEYSKYIAQIQKDEAFTLKQQRQWREEQSTRSRGRGSGDDAGGGAGGEDGGAGRFRGRGRGRAGRAHGDPFPLPLLGRSTPREVLPLSLSSGVRRRCNQAIMALNDLDAPLAAARRLASVLPANAAQASVLQRVHQRVAAFGDPIGVDGDDALCSLLKSKDVYSGRPTPVRPYEPRLLKVLDSGISPQPIRSLVPPWLLPLINEPEKHIFRSQAVLDSMVEAGELPPIYPYWDANLRRDPVLRLGLFKQLMRIGLVGVRTRCRARASIFFVGKKDGSLRMVIDGREPSALHRRPPRTELGSAAALSGLCLDADLLGSDGQGYHGASADLRQGFYQMQWLEIGSWFCFDYPMPIRNFDTDQVYDEVHRRFVQVDPDTVVYPCFQGLAMGWSWSLFICNGITEDVTRVGISRALCIAPEEVRMVSERSPCARLGAGELAGASYVDNANVVGSPRRLVDAALEAILLEFERRGLAYHEVCYATRDFVCCGVRFDFSDGRAVPQRERAWRLHRAVTALIDRRGCTPAAMEVVLGHVVHHFMLMRPALAVLSSLYRVVYAPGDYCHFDAEQLRELGLVKALIPLAGVDLGAPWHPWAYCSDASLWGYALATSRFDESELRDIGAYRERWRFVAIDRHADDPGDPPGTEVATQAGFTAGSDDAAVFAGLDLPPRAGRSSPRLAARRSRAARVDVEAPASAACRGGIPALPDAALAAHRWQLVVRGAFLFSAPIHILEGRTTLLGLRRATRSVAAHGCRVLSIGDNLSSMMAFEKGRCANPVLRQLACQAAARQIATGIQHYHRYSESSRNPTDHDSRAADRFELEPGQTQRGAPRDLAPAPPPAPAASPAGGAGPHRLGARPRERRRARHVLELYAGCARLTAACLDAGLQSWVPVDISRGPWHDLSDKRIISVIRSLIVRRDVWYVHFGTPCTPFSLATPARSRAKHFASGSASVSFTIDMLRLCERFGVRWSVENPSSSRLWHSPEVTSFLDRHCHYFVYMHYCHYNCRYLKPTTLVTNLKPLQALEASCSRDHVHEVLAGKVRLGPKSASVWKTSLAGRYPEALARKWAGILRECAPAAGRLDGARPECRGEAQLAAAAECDDWTRTPDPVCPAAGHQEWSPDQLGWGSCAAQAPRRRSRLAVGSQRAANNDVAREDFLARRRVKPLTQQHYARAAAEVRRFAIQHRYPLATPAQRDKLMVDYLQSIFLAGDGIFAARTALYGYAFEERVNLRDVTEFPQARLTLKGFAKASPGEQRDPCPWEAALLIIDQCLTSHCPRQQLVGAGVAVAFDGYLRLSELLHLKACDVTCLRHSATSAYPQVSITLMPAAPADCPPSVTTKAGEYDDTVTFGGIGSAGISRRWVAKLLRDLKATTPPTRPLFPFSHREFEVAFREAADAAGLQRLRLCPHSLRHGGASTDFALKHRSLAEVQRRGRWKCAASVRRYEKAGRLTRQLAKLSRGQLSDAARVGRRLAAKSSFVFGGRSE
ncbi:unnamed protein product, partial [Prorocentrum cordatum]